ncbi:M48 family metallopeptidase [Natronorubrum daqingense]|nr:M48 family metallopeptidase [Natronorubrum daqingense]SIR19712.1 heat shock protein HtpX [Natronorubrum daqingense]
MRVGLWIRMTLAFAALLASVLVLLAVEFLTIWLLVGMVHFGAVYVSYVVLSPVPLAAFAVGYVAFVGALWFAYNEYRLVREPDRDASRAAVVDAMGANRRTIRERYGLVGYAFVVGVLGASFGTSLLLGERFGETAYYAFVPLFVALTVVWHQFSTTLRTERRNEAAVLRSLEDSIRRSDDEQRHPELHDLRRRVERLARQADVPVPSLEVAVRRTPIALTVGYRPESSTVVVSKGLVETLTEQELEAVLAHEIAHIANRDAAVASVMAIPIATAERIEQAQGGHAGAIALVLRGFSRWWLRIVTRYREYAADDGAVAITGDPAALASALEELDRSVARRPVADLRNHRTAAAFSIVPSPWEERRFFDRVYRFVDRRLFGTHPPTDERIERLRAQTADPQTGTAES